MQENVERDREKLRKKTFNYSTFRVFLPSPSSSSFSIYSNVSVGIVRRRLYWRTNVVCRIVRVSWYITDAWIIIIIVFFRCCSTAHVKPINVTQFEIGALIFFFCFFFFKISFVVWFSQHAPPPQPSVSVVYCRRIVVLLHDAPRCNLYSIWLLLGECIKCNNVWIFYKCLFLSRLFCEVAFCFPLPSMCKCVVKHTPKRDVRASDRDTEHTRMKNIIVCTHRSQRNHQRATTTATTTGTRTPPPQWYARRTRFVIRLHRTDFTSKKPHEKKNTKIHPRIGKNERKIVRDSDWWRVSILIFGTMNFYSPTKHRTKLYIYSFFYFIFFDSDESGIFVFGWIICLSCGRLWSKDFGTQRTKTEEKNTIRSTLTRLRKTERRSREITVPALFTH